jgi:hypothetical protein
MPAVRRQLYASSSMRMPSERRPGRVSGRLQGVRAWDSRFSESQAADKPARFVVDADGG